MRAFRVSYARANTRMPQRRRGFCEGQYLVCCTMIRAVPEVLPTRDVNRWYRLPQEGASCSGDFFAERYFDSENEALAYWQKRAEELGFERVHRPVSAHENPAVWAVCIVPT